MADEKKTSSQPSSLMDTVAAIVEAVLEKQGLILSAQRPSPWKAAHREDMAQIQGWRDIGWSRV